MKRACYRKNDKDRFEILRVKSLRTDGHVDTEAIDIFKGIEFDSLLEMMQNASLSGYGIIGSIDEVRRRNKERSNRIRNGQNIMNPDDL